MLPHPTTPILLSITLFSATYCTDLPKYYSVPSCYTEAPAGYSTKTVEYYTEAPKFYSAPIYTTTTEAAKYYAVPTYYTEAALWYYVEQKYYTDAPVYYTTTCATPSYDTAVPNYYTEETAYYNHLRCLVYYTEVPKYYITKALGFYTSMYAAPTYYTKALHYYNTEALKYYTTTYAPPSYYTYVPKFYCALKESSKKKEVVPELQCPICHQLHSSSCNPFAIMGKYFYFYIEFCINSIFFFFFKFAC
jgi:hypothetical protein